MHDAREIECGTLRLKARRPWHSVLAITIGCPLVIPVLVTYVRCVGRVQDVERIATGRSRPGYGLTALLAASALIPPLYSHADAEAMLGFRDDRKARAST